MSFGLLLYPPYKYDTCYLSRTQLVLLSLSLAVYLAPLSCDLTFAHLRAPMASVSATSATFRASLKPCFKNNQVTGGTSTTVKMARAGWAKNVFPTLRTSRFNVCCAQAKPETVQKVCEIVKKQLALSDETELTPESKFAALGADSLDTVEIVMGLEEEFGISVEEESSQNITTVQEAADLIEKLVQKKPEA